MENENLFDRIARKQEKLRDASQKLKEHFVGIDNVIDRIISNIEAWYCMPEIMMRPTIVCLWGLTGIGKTDLVRRLVKCLDMSDSFVELQLTNRGSSTHVYNSTLQGLLSGSNVSPSQPGVLLLDEIQRFRSIDNDGKDIHDYMFQDLWMLLSDGSFGSVSDNKNLLYEMLIETAYEEDYNRAKLQVGPSTDDDDDEEEDKREDEIQKRRLFKQTYWSARQIKRQLRLPESIEDIMKWDPKKKIEVLEAKMKDKSIFAEEVYQKLLIFVSGNIDEAYDMADETDETDVDADIFHKHSLKINLLDIKSALRQRFKPEQIARFGNTHVVYPALSRGSYEEIIKRKVAEVIQRVKQVSTVSIVPDETVFDAIYRNGVFPAQGTRPVFSTISCFFECLLPKFTYEALKAGQREVHLWYEDKHLCAKIGGEMVRQLNEGDIDKIKTDKKSVDFTHKIAVHEAGHAVVYAKLFGLVPTQCVISVASDDRAGFIGIHTIESNKTLLLNRITVNLAGKAAESIVFNDDMVSAGAASDLQTATTFVAAMIRQYGMGDYISKMDSPTSALAIGSYTDIARTNDEVERVMKRQYEEACMILAENLPLLKELSDLLIEQEKVEADVFIPLCARHGIEVKHLDAKETVYPKYGDIYKGFVESRWPAKKAR